MSQRPVGRSTAQTIAARNGVDAREPPCSTSSIRKDLIRHPADRFQVALAVIGPIVLVFPFFVSLALPYEIALWGLVWLFVCRHNYILHNHVHRPFTRSKWLNRLIAAMLGFCTGMTTGNWKITHVHGHHVEDKIELLPSRRYVRYLQVGDTERFSYLSALRHALRTAPLQWIIPIYIMVRESLRPASFRSVFYRFYFVELLAVYTVVTAFFIAQPVKAFCYFGLMYMAVYVISRHVDYITHVACDSTSRYGFANVCIHPQYNRLLWNFGYHVAHHLDPRAHWTSLPSIYNGLSAEEGKSVATTVNYFGRFVPAVFHWQRLKDIGER